MPTTKKFVSGGLAAVVVVTAGVAIDGSGFSVDPLACHGGPSD